MKLKPWFFTPFCLSVQYILVKQETTDIFGLCQKNVATYVPNFPTNQSKCCDWRTIRHLEQLQTHNLTNPASMHESSTLIRHHKINKK